MRVSLFLLGMDTTSIISAFERIGARARFAPPLFQRQWSQSERRIVNSVVDAGFSIDIQKDREGEFFQLRSSSSSDLLVLDFDKRDRHLLLMSQPTAGGAFKSKFLCGHDERHWFVAGVPEAAPVGTVIAAKQALKPLQVIALESRVRGSLARKQKRRTETFVRQGEWFFLPRPDAKVNSKLIRRNEPLSRGRGKSHWCEELYRDGGTLVYVSRSYPRGLTEGEYRALISRKPKVANDQWQTLRRNPMVYVRGRVSHADHATIRLDGWHQVLMNTEGQSRAMSQVAFLD